MPQLSKGLANGLADYCLPWSTGEQVANMHLASLPSFDCGAQQTVNDRWLNQLIQPDAKVAA